MTRSGIVTFALLLATSMVGGLMQVRASRFLTPEQQNQVVTIRAMRRVSRMFLAIYIPVGLFVLAVMGVPVRLLNFYVLAVVTAGVAMWAHVTYFRKLRALGLPSEYLDSVLHSRVVVYFGVLAIFAMFVYKDMHSR